MSLNKDMRTLMKEAEHQGWVIKPTNGGHYKWLSPLGQFVISSQTPSDFRVIHKIKRDLRMYGFIEIKIKKKGRR